MEISFSEYALLWIGILLFAAGANFLGLNGIPIWLFLVAVAVLITACVIIDWLLEVHHALEEFKKLRRRRRQN